MAAVHAMTETPIITTSAITVDFVDFADFAIAIPLGMDAPQIEALRLGLRAYGHIEGQNIAVEYRWAEGRYDRSPAMAADLVHRQVAVIVASATPSAVAAKGATSTIPIIFGIGGDPIKLGLVKSVAHPDGNATGINFFTN